MTTSFISAIEDEYIYTKIVKISPYFIFSNCCDMRLQIGQEGCSEYYFIINPGEQQEFHFPNVDGPRRITIRMAELASQHFEWDWSESIGLKELGPMTIRCRSLTKPGCCLLIKINRRLYEGIFISEVYKESEEHPNYRIKNCSKYFSLQYWQKGIK